MCLFRHWLEVLFHTPDKVTSTLDPRCAPPLTPWSQGRQRCQEDADQTPFCLSVTTCDLSNWHKCVTLYIVDHPHFLFKSVPYLFEVKYSSEWALQSNLRLNISRSGLWICLSPIHVVSIFKDTLVGQHVRWWFFLTQIVIHHTKFLNAPLSC